MSKMQSNFSPYFRSCAVASSVHSYWFVPAFVTCLLFHYVTTMLLTVTIARAVTELQQ